ncbi:MAG: tetratricopeptide repeat protein [Patescibacteria group bacterium]
MPNLNAREIHAQSEQAREADELDLALDLISKAILQYQEEKNLAGQAEALCSKFLALKHKYRKTGETKYLEQAREEVEKAVAIAEKLDDKSGLIIPLINLSKVLEELGQAAEALPHYERAAELNKETVLKNHDQDLLAVDIELHLGLAKLESKPKKVDETALSQIETSLKNLNSGKENRDSFRVNVLISGAYLRLAKYFKDKDLDKTKVYLKLATQLINEDERLVLRKEQLKTFDLE